MEQEITNQHLVARPCHVNVHPAGSQRELGPQLVHQLKGAPNRNTSISDDTLERTSNVASGAPGSSTSNRQQRDTLDRE